VAALHIGSSLPSPQKLGHPDPIWLAIALLAELASLVAYALIVRELLAAGGVAGRTAALLRATVGGIAMAATLPAGQALSGTYWYKQLRREGAERGLAAVVLGAVSIAGLFSLTGILIIGVALAGDAGPLAHARLPILGAAVALLALRIVLHRRFAELARGAFARFAPAASGHPKIRAPRLAAVATLAYVNWLLDCGSLLAALAATHASIPAQSVLLTYALAQLVASVPLLPGGGGTVEISLALGFAAFCHTSDEVLAGILLYRLISCWGLAPIGWIAVAVDRHHLGRSDSRRKIGAIEPAAAIQAG
jgi:uncharacterized membrane protein YbhN (UPF0104 family)